MNKKVKKIFIKKNQLEISQNHNPKFKNFIEIIYLLCYTL